MLKEPTHKVLFEGGPFHGRVTTINAPPPSTMGVNRGFYHHIGRVEAGHFLYRWKGGRNPHE